MVHSAIDAVSMEGMHGMGGGMEQEMGGGRGSAGSVEETLASFVETGTITQVQADAFWVIHAKLEEAGLMK
jgi:hypothetical protein